MVVATSVVEFILQIIWQISISFSMEHGTFAILF